MKRRLAVWLLALGMAVLTPQSAGALLANAGLAILNWLDRAQALHHDIRLRLDPTAMEIEIADRVRYRAETGLRQVYFLLGSDFVMEGAARVDGGRVPVAISRFLEVPGAPIYVYRVQLDKPVSRGGEFELELRYRIDWRSVSAVSPFLPQKTIYLGVDSFWHPYSVKDHFFTARVEAKAPEGIGVIGEGRPVAEGVWETSRPVRALGLAAGPFRTEVAARAHETPVYASAAERYWEDAAEIARFLAKAVAFLEERMGPLDLDRIDVVRAPFYWPAAYAYLSQSAYGGGLSEVGIASEAERAVFAGHEAANKWLGNTVAFPVLGAGWAVQGLSEHLGVLAAEESLGREAAHSVVKARSPFALGSEQARRRPLASIEMHDDAELLLARKGMWVFRMIHGRMGDEAFFAGLRSFVERYRGRRAGPAELIAELEAHSGEPLGGLVRAWTRGTGVLDYAIADGRLLAAEDGSHRLELAVVSRGTVRNPSKAAVRILLADGSEHWAEVDLASGDASVTACLPARPVEAEIDPELWLADADRSNNVWRPPDGP